MSTSVIAATEDESSASKEVRYESIQAIQKRANGVQPFA
jgi:hypothetical protein